jgi:hypothetical protein
VQITIRSFSSPGVVDNGQSFAPIGLYKTDAASDWLLIKHTALVKASRESSYKINGVIYKLSV